MKRTSLFLIILMVVLSANAQEKQFRRACQKNNQEAYTQYIQNYPLSAFTEEAFYRRTILINTEVAYEAFLGKYPNGPFTAPVIDTLCQIRYNQIANSNNIMAIMEFMALPYHCGSCREKAGNRLVMLEFNEARSKGSIDAYQEFQNKYPESQYKEQIKSGIAKIEFETAVNQKSVQALNIYIAKYPNSVYRIQAKNAIEEIEVSTALQSNSIDSLNKYLLKYPKNAALNEFKRKIEENDYLKAKEANEIKAYIAFLKKYPDGYFSKEVSMILEKFAYDQIRDSRDKNQYEKHLQEYPEGHFSKDAKNRINDISMYEKAKSEDWYSDYRKYLNQFPNGLFKTEATERMEWLKSNKADIVADFPKSVKGGTSPYYNVSSPFFKWHVTFKEKSGLIGYKVSGQGWYYDKDGSAWGSSAYSGSSTGEIIVEPGKTNTYDTWFSGSRFVGGYILFDFTGEDAGGHPIHIQVRIDCK
jgi:outer membrane protein assembly factor BamD (BamD/ComL family)